MSANAQTDEGVEGQRVSLRYRDPAECVLRSDNAVKVERRSRRWRSEFTKPLRRE